MTILIDCRECGRVRSETGLEAAALARLALCFECRFWTDLVERAGSPDQVRFNGAAYMIGAETATLPRVMRGFGGARFRIRFLDGRLVETTNLWSRGRIPTHFRARLPDNAASLHEIAGAA